MPRAQSPEPRAQSPEPRAQNIVEVGARNRNFRVVEIQHDAFDAGELGRNIATVLYFRTARVVRMTVQRVAALLENSPAKRQRRKTSSQPAP